MTCYRSVMRCGAVRGPMLKSVAVKSLNWHGSSSSVYLLFFSLSLLESITDLAESNHFIISRALTSKVRTQRHWQ